MLFSAARTTTANNNNDDDAGSLLALTSFPGVPSLPAFPGIPLGPDAPWRTRQPQASLFVQIRPSISYKHTYLDYFAFFGTDY